MFKLFINNLLKLFNICAADTEHAATCTGRVLYLLLPTQTCKWDYISTCKRQSSGSVTNMDIKKCSSCELYSIGKCEDLINKLLAIPGEKTITNISCKVFTCCTCKQNQALLNRVQEQNIIIANLDHRVNSLTAIRHMEFDLDNLSKQFSEISFGSHNDVSLHIPPIVATEETHPIVDTTAASINTTVWDSSQNNDSRFSYQSTHQKSSETQTDKIVLVNQGTQTCPMKFSESKDQEMQTMPDSKNTAENREVIIIDETPHSLDEAKEPSLIVGSEAFNRKITTFLIGDNTLKHVTLTSKSSTFKIARSNTTATDLIETTKYYLDKFPNVKTIVFQTVHSDMANCGTELLKLSYNNLIDIAKTYGAKLVISGPIPDPRMISESFSRSSNINDWFLEQEGKGCCKFVDNFTVFWKKPHFFHKRSSVLEKQGVQTLASALNHILDC